MESLTPKRKGIILLILLIATILSPLDFYIANLALTPIQKGLHTTSGQLQMVVSFYTCAYAVFQITGGRLGDLFGRKQMFLTGLMGFILSSGICGLAISPQMIILGRVLQGISGAIMAPQILAIIHVTYSEKEKTRVMALYSFTFGLAAVLGQYLGGLLIEHNILNMGWRVIFLINIPIGLIAWFGAVFLLPKPAKSETRGTIDGWGMLLLSLGLGLVVYPLTLVTEHGWSSSVWSMLLCSMLLLIFFVKYQKWMLFKGKEPLIDLSVFKYKNLTIGSIVAFLFYCSGIFYLGLGIYLQEYLRWSAIDAGTAIIPFGIGFLLSSLGSPCVVKWIGNRILNIGILIKAIGLFILIYSLSLPQPIGLLFYVALFIAGSGMGLTLSSIVRISLLGVAHKHAGVASGVINCALQIGSAIGVAGLGSLFFHYGKVQDYSYAFQMTLGALIVLFMVAFALSFLITKKR